ncbi:MAG: hypothetical protein ABIC91_02670 [Nanoarchaeota archaeon]
MRRVFYLIILMSVILSICSTDSSAAAIGVNKAVLDFQDVLKSGYAQDTLIVSTDVKDNIEIEYEIQGEIKEWIRFEPEELVLVEGKAGQLTVIVEPPADTPNGIYLGEIKLLTSSIIKEQMGKMGSAIRTSFLIKTKVEVTGDEIISCSAGGFRLLDSEIGFPLDFSATVKNNGNVRIKPDFGIEIYNQEQTKKLLTKTFTHQTEILPTTKAELTRQLEDMNLDTGQYWASVSSPLCGDSGLITFDVLDKGAIVDKGEILSLNANLWVKIGDIVPIEAIFKNTGTRVESVKLKGTITLGDGIVKVIDTDSVNVLPGETITLETFFNPKMIGQYHVNVRALYNNKLTFEKGTVINAQSSSEFERKIKALNTKNLLSVLSLIIIVIIILILLILIKKKKKHKKR